MTPAAEFRALFAQLDDNAKRLLAEIIIALEHGWLICAEVHAASDCIRNGADRVAELENLVDLSYRRRYDSLLKDQAVTS